MATGETDRLRQLLDVIVRSIEEPGLSGADVARRAFLSRFHFDRLVGEALGEPPSAFRRRLLLERAAYSLRRNEKPVSEVAFDTGYGSPEAFSRAFRRAFGSSPSTHARSGAPLHIEAPNGIHFHPPGGLRLPTQQRSTAMDVLERMIEHDSWLIERMLGHAADLDDATLDQKIMVSTEGFDDEDTLRGLLGSLVSQKERWVAAVAGRPDPELAGEDVASLTERYRQVAPEWLGLTRSALRDGRAGETFIDATCDPPHSFTFGGMIAHVLTFAAFRRTLAATAFREAGVESIGWRDPSDYVADPPSTATMPND